jgi:hypothetical protein
VKDTGPGVVINSMDEKRRHGASPSPVAVLDSRVPQPIPIGVKRQSQKVFMKTCNAFRRSLTDGLLSNIHFFITGRHYQRHDAYTVNRGFSRASPPGCRMLLTAVVAYQCKRLYVRIPYVYIPNMCRVHCFRHHSSPLTSGDPPGESSRRWKSHEHPPSRHNRHFKRRSTTIPDGSILPLPHCGCNVARQNGTG